jgi:hypothetical protein
MKLLPEIFFENWRATEKVMGVFKKDFMKNSRYSTQT